MDYLLIEAEWIVALEEYRTTQQPTRPLKAGPAMPITVKVQPDLSAFRSATPDEIAEVLEDCADIPSVEARVLIEHFTILPK